MSIYQRIKREVKNNIFRYIALVAILILSISIVVGMVAGSDSIINGKIKLRKLTKEEFKNLTGLIRIMIYALLIENNDVNDESDRSLELFCDMIVKYVVF